ncbi:hypothetical protein COV20_05865 [Candidatus Woesearchaeota archaeon CG10_big_fil_rev_8_21_14_0_10_45_16]|nr:MAG: hypothetical protein COV20_05865 [Candidatus Woesearchaeota archaeon CG10_big_fil_rev_8_21_14_0_10_45_16]
MRTSWLVGSLITFIIGFILTITIVGAVLGIPLLSLSIIILIIGLFLPAQKKVHIHHHHHPKK